MTDKSSAQIQVALDATLAELAAATTQQTTLEAALAAAVAGLSDDDHRAREDEVIAARRVTVRLDARVTALRLDLTAAVEREDEAERRARYDELKSHAEKLAQEYGPRYCRLASELIALLTDVQTLDRDIEAMNRRLPKDREPLVGVEQMSRHEPGTPDRIERVLRPRRTGGTVTVGYDGEVRHVSLGHHERDVPATYEEVVTRGTPPKRPAPLHDVVELPGFAEPVEVYRVAGTWRHHY